ncbi:MAG TPA: hypothetical protein VK927_07595 [Adhaeribacter sp.]|nr:hypothetical protein [Adhaeribacter sp.]
MLLLPLLTGCWGGSDVSFPKEPHIEFKSISARTFIGDFSQAQEVEFTVALTFQDGDGNLGLDNSNPADSLAPFDFRQGTNKFHNNYFIEAFIEKDGEFVPANLPVTLNGRYPILNPDGKIQALEGELRYTFGKFFVAFLPFHFQSGDRMKFRIQIADRDLNLSNVIDTDPVQIFF